jgi:transposase
LYEYEANLRDQIIARRNEEYRKFAAGVVRKYGYVVLELFDLAEMAKKPMPDQGVKTSLPPNKYRFIAAPSELRNAIENACKREGILVERVNPDYTTQGKRKIMPTS